jgi:nitroreductase
MDLLEAMRTTGTTRYFTDDPVPDEVLYRALDAARFGPQGGNRQPVHFVVVRDEETKQRLADLYLPLYRQYFEKPVIPGVPHATGQPARDFAESFARVPALVVVCAAVVALHPTDDELGRLSVVGGGSIYPIVQNLCLALRAEGVGSALTTLLCRREPEVKELLGIPEGYLTAGHVAVGFPARGFPRSLRRGPVEEMVSLGRFGTPMFGGLAEQAG